MQETRPIEMTTEQAEQFGKIRREFFAGGQEFELQGRMDKRLGELNREHDETLVRRKKIGRNDPCPCGSGRKFKTCCITGLRRN